MPFALDSLLQLIVTYKGEGGGGVGATQSKRMLHRARPPPKPIFSTPQALLPLDLQDADVSLCCCLSRMRTEQRKEGKFVWSAVKKNFYVRLVRQFFGVLTRPLWLAPSRQRVGRVNGEGCVVGWAGRQLTC